MLDKETKLKNVIVSNEDPYDKLFSSTKEEVWYFDKQRSQLQVRVLGLCPVWEYFDQSTQRNITIDMFWIYFPEARHVLARAEVFNRKNGAERRTYDDIFWKRMFSSYVYKEENV